MKLEAEQADRSVNVLTSEREDPRANIVVVEASKWSISEDAEGEVI